MLLSTKTGELITDGKSARKYFPVIADAGFGAVDFTFNAVFGYGRVKKTEKFDALDLPKEKMLDYFSEIKKAADENNIVFGQTHAHYPTLLPTYEDEYNNYLLECLKKEVEITGLFNCPYIVIHPVFGGAPGEYTEKEEHDLTFGVLTALIPLLKKYNVKVCLENMWYSDKGKIYGAACTDWNTVNNWIDELNEISGEKLFGFCFDTGHAVLVGSDPVKGITALSDKVMTVHLHDVDGFHDSHTFPFAGVANWDRIMKALSDIGYTGTLNFEAENAWKMFPEELYTDAINLLGKIGRYFIDTYFNA